MAKGKAIIMLVAAVLLVLAAGCGSGGKVSFADLERDQITDETVLAALKSERGSRPIFYDTGFVDNITQVLAVNNESEDPEDDGLMIVIQYSTSPSYDETATIDKFGGTVIAIDSVIYTNPYIKNVLIYCNAETVDSYGVTQTEQIAKIAIWPETAEKVDWAGLAKMHGGDPGNIYRIADSYWIMPDIKQLMDPGRIWFD